MFAYYCPRGNGDDGERLALGALNGPRFACVQDAGRDLIFGNPGWSVIVACEQPQNGKRHIRAAARSASRNHFSTRPTTANGIERQRQIGIVLVGVVTLNFKVLSGINKSAAGFAYRIGVPYIYVAAQAGAQQRVESAIHGDNVVALLR